MSTKAVGDLGSQLTGMVSTNVNAYTKLLADFNVFGLALGFVVANNVTLLANAFIDDVVMPSVKPALERVSKGSENLEIEIGSVKVQLGSFIQKLIRFFVLSVVIYLAVSFGVNMNKPTQWVEVRNWPASMK